MQGAKYRIVHGENGYCPECKIPGDSGFSHSYIYFKTLAKAENWVESRMAEDNGRLQVVKTY